MFSHLKNACITANVSYRAGSVMDHVSYKYRDGIFTLGKDF